MTRDESAALPDVAKELSQRDYSDLARFRQALRRFLRHAELGARAGGLTPQQHQLLLAIRASESLQNVGELAEALQLKHHTVTELVIRCESAGLVSRSRHGDDRRTVTVEITESGRSKLSRLSVQNLEELKRLRASLDIVLLSE